MERDRKRLIEQSQGKPKSFKSREKKTNLWSCTNQKQPEVFLPSEVVDPLKQMNPQEVANIPLDTQA